MMDRSRGIDKKWLDRSRGIDKKWVDSLMNGQLVLVI